MSLVGQNEAEPSPHIGEDGSDYSLYLIGSGEGRSYASSESLLVEGVL